MDKISEWSLDNIAEKPTADDFDLYLPWACGQFQIDVNLDIIRVQSTVKSSLSRHVKEKHKKSLSNIFTSKYEGATRTLDSPGFNRSVAPSNISLPNYVRIYATYDQADNLCQLKFDKNKKVESKVLRVIGLFLHYHKLMTRITINSGIDNKCLHELTKLLALASITDICLDNTAFTGGYYDMLLRDRNKLKYLSLSRCNINDDTVNKIAYYLQHPQATSKTLLVLNLASNFIADPGAKYLATALRTNRQLVYLNLAGNRITDSGASEIFGALTDFVITDEELKSFRSRKIQFIKDKNKLVEDIFKELTNTDVVDINSQRKRTKSSPQPLGFTSKRGKDISKKLTVDFDTFFLEKARLRANDKMSELEEPFSPEYVYCKNNTVYCYGNNRMSYINISYNNITYLTVKNILSVVLDQQNQNRIPRGLVNVSLEGNFIPEKCRELEEIDFILSSNISDRKESKRRNTKCIPKYR